MLRRYKDGLRCIAKETKLGSLSPMERNSVTKEASLLATLDHPNIVHFYESFEINNTLYIMYVPRTHVTCHKSRHQLPTSCVQKRELQVPSKQVVLSQCEPWVTRLGPKYHITVLKMGNPYRVQKGSKMHFYKCKP